MRKKVSYFLIGFLFSIFGCVKDDIDRLDAFLSEFKFENADGSYAKVQIGERGSCILLIDSSTGCYSCQFDVNLIWHFAETYPQTRFYVLIEGRAEYRTFEHILSNMQVGKDEAREFSRFFNLREGIGLVSLNEDGHVTNVITTFPFEKRKQSEIVNRILQEF